MRRTKVLLKTKKRNQLIRDHWIATALLLGYKFERPQSRGVALRKPEGGALITFNEDRIPIVFHASRWSAACAALKHAGLNPDEVIPEEVTK